MSDESIIKRIHALMAKTTSNGCSEAEALSASQKVQELLHKHQLSMSDIRIKEEKCDTDYYDIQMKSDQPIVYVANAIAEFTDTKVWKTKDRNGYVQIAYFGFEADVLIAKYITKICDRAIIFAYEQYRQSPDFLPGALGKKSFQEGMAFRLSSRIREMKKAQQKQDIESTGRDLVVVKGAVVTEEFAKLNMRLGQSKRRGRHYDGSAFSAGSNAANKVNINPGVGNSTGAYLK